ncbi:transglycosylase domain-containing protein [Patescibacteria group bacterium]|nr:transglycosylase domain-containing protein [Patescibacteria group bacterium]
MKKKIIIVVLLILGSVFIIDSLITVSRLNQNKGSIRIYDLENNLIYEYITDLEGYQNPVKVDELPEYVKYSVISAEDSSFYKHFGISPLGILRALILNIKAKRIVSGGSTITQQVARNNLAFNEGILSSKVIRKVRELYSSFFIEVFYSKDRILSEYLTAVYMGNNSYGIEAAAYTYYGKPASQLSLPEAALLAGVIRSPVALNPKDSADAGVGRRNEILDLMYKNGYIPQDDLNLYKEFPSGVNFTNRNAEFLHFVDYVLEEAKTILVKDEVSDLEGLDIYTTLNPSISRIAQKSAQDHVAFLQEDHKLSNAAVVVMDSFDSGILAMIGSVDYFNEEIDGAVNVAISPRQPGSALKPITYGQAFYRGLLTPESTILDEKTAFIDKNGKSFVPYNYNGVFNGPVTARVALASSLNLPAVKVLDMLGVEDMLSAAQKLGVKSLDNPDRYDLSVTLGGGEVTLLELTNAYASLSRGGVFKDVYSIAQIRDENDIPIYEHKVSSGEKAWEDKSEEIASALHSILSDSSAKVLGFGRNNVLELPFACASKTGTTTDWHDNWTFGYTKGLERDFSVGVWVGNSDHSPMYSIDGVTGAGPIWRDVMLETYDILLIQYPNDISKEGDSDVAGDNSILNRKDNGGDIEGEKNENVGITKNHITNPPPNSEYVILPSESNFERILMEVTVSDEVFAVEYFLDGTSLGTYYEKDAFKYLWSPSKGSHTVEAHFKDANLNIIGKESSDFVVRSAES